MVRSFTSGLGRVTRAEPWPGGQPFTGFLRRQRSLRRWDWQKAAIGLRRPRRLGMAGLGWVLLGLGRGRVCICCVCRSQARSVESVLCFYLLCSFTKTLITPRDMYV